jgi:hypothetical protein
VTSANWTSSVSICRLLAFIHIPRLEKTHSLEVRLWPGGIVHGEREFGGLDGGVELVDSNFIGLDSAGLDICLLDDTFDSDERFSLLLAALPGSSLRGTPT